MFSNFFSKIVPFMR